MGPGSLRRQAPLVPAARKVIYRADQYENDPQSRLETYYRRFGYDQAFLERLVRAEVLGATETPDAIIVTYGYSSGRDAAGDAWRYTIKYSRRHSPAPLEILSEKPVGHLTSRLVFSGWKESSGLLYPSQRKLFFPLRCGEKPVEVLRVQRLQFNAALPASLFAIEIPPGSEVQDSRVFPPLISTWE